MEGYAGQIPNSGHELAFYVLWLIIVKLCWQNFIQSAYFMIFFVSSISYRTTVYGHYRVAQTVQMFIQFLAFFFSGKLWHSLKLDFFLHKKFQWFCFELWDLMLSSQPYSWIDNSVTSGISSKLWLNQNLLDSIYTFFQLHTLFVKKN